MKLFIAILLMSTVLLSESVSVFDLVKMEDHHIDSTYEGEVEKEFSENFEDVVKIKFANPIFSDVDELMCSEESGFIWSLSTHYLEIPSPPPDFN